MVTMEMGWAEMGMEWLGSCFGMEIGICCVSVDLQGTWCWVCLFEKGLVELDKDAKVGC